MSKTTQATSAAKATAPTTEKVTLLKNHTHLGKQCVVGDEIDVTAPEKAWLAEREIIAGDKAPEGKE